MPESIQLNTDRCQAPTRVAVNLRRSLSVRSCPSNMTEVIITDHTHRVMAVAVAALFIR